MFPTEIIKPDILKFQEDVFCDYFLSIAILCNDACFSFPVILANDIHSIFLQLQPSKYLVCILSLKDIHILQKKCQAIILCEPENRSLILGIISLSKQLLYDWFIYWYVMFGMPKHCLKKSLFFLCCF